MKRECLRGLEDDYDHVRPINFGETQEGCCPALERVLQKRVLYYSDFDVDVNDWKAEQQALSIFAKTMLANLSTGASYRRVAESWISVAVSPLNKEKSKTSPERSAWEVGLEYAFLTMHSPKVHPLS